MTADTNDAPAADAATTPALARVRVATVAMHAKAKSLAHMKAVMSSLNVAAMPPAVNAWWIAAQRADRWPLGSPRAVMSIFTGLWTTSPLDTTYPR